MAADTLQRMNTATKPSDSAPYLPQIRLYQNWLRDKRGLSFATYNDLWRWSVTELDTFWQSIWDYFDFQSPTPHTAVLANNVMPGAKWFPGAQTNYAHQVLRHVQPAHDAGFLAVISHNEKGLRREMTWPELRRQVAAMALHLQAQGVQPGDRVAAYLPNIPEAMVAFLATASVGGVWSICAPDMGTNAVLDRFKQIEPKVLIAVDGVSYGGRDFDRMGVVQELRDALPSVQHVIIHDNLGTLDLTNCDVGSSVQMSAITARDDAQVQAFEPMWLPFDHPLWIVYSSGTTGLPKPIVHGHGGTVIVALANKILHNDIGCSYHPNSWGERFHWYSSTGWVMWNAQVAGLLNGVTCVIYDGNPGGSKENPDWGILWRMAGAGKGHVFWRRRSLLCQLPQSRFGHFPQRRPVPHPRLGHHRIALVGRHTNLGRRAIQGHWHRHLVVQYFGRHRLCGRLCGRPPRTTSGAWRHAMPRTRLRGRGLERSR